MITPDWNIFKAKFSGKEAKTFEWFCYLLFCKEFNCPQGTMRYINQAGVEAEPIDRDGKIIGWQAKFFKKRLSERTKDFIKSIDTAKRKHPKINKILFYTNQDFGQGQTDSAPKHKKEIEEHARKKGIKIEWKTNSFFESPFVCETHKDISEYFFKGEKSTVDLIKELSQHTQNILNQIHSEIKFRENTIKIDRAILLEKLKAFKNHSQSIILTGEAGVGKTAIIKDFYESIKNQHPLFIFKAGEFKIDHINDLFKKYGDFSLLNFIEWYKQFDKKYIVIDSAEKLSDIENTEPFKEFLSALIKNQWQIIFTKRYRYLDDLKFQLSEIYNIKCSKFNVSFLTNKKIAEFAKTHNFNLPKNAKFLNLLKTPFYLNEYLKNYSDMDININYSTFKGIIWDKKILSSVQKDNIHIRREECFLNLAKKRANAGNFFIKASPPDSDKNILQKLESDEIIKYDKTSGAYFITHDIYEEWALNIIIKRAFLNRENDKNFFNSIGNSLPIRRSFRDWMSEKLSDEDQEIKTFIEDSIQDKNIEKYWKDEILVSVLLSNYCSHFFRIFESELLKESKKYRNNESQNQFQSHYDQGLLYKLIFWLRIACKEIDESMFDLFGFSKTERNKKIFETILTKPKGDGWNCLIDFLNKHKEKFDLHYIDLILPVIEDWNNKNRKGKTTKTSSLLALFYYNRIMDEKYNYKFNEIKKRLITKILNGSFEIQKELINIFQSIISNKETDQNSRYYKLVKSILLSPAENIEIIKNLPDQVIQLAELFWTYQPEKKQSILGIEGIQTPNQKLELEECFSITSNYEFKYFPPSALKTPIFYLLSFSYKQTVDFILSFVNKSIESFAKSRFADELEEVEVFIDKKTFVKQYISYRLWDVYRGRNQVPYLLESIHMALERYFLNNCKNMDSSELEEKLLYLLKNSKSSSITAVVASIVLAYPEKTFNIAKILFQTKKFILFDNNYRWALDQISHNNQMKLDQLPYTNNLSTEDNLCKIERLEYNQLKHKKQSLEHLAFKYQIYSPKGIDKKEVKNRQQNLWRIFDNHYQQLSNQNNETEEDKKWRLCLARMDLRKMKSTVEKKDGKHLMKFKPKIAPNLKKYIEESLNMSNEENKYIPLLKMWSTYKFENKKDHKNKDHLKYENNPELVIKETKDIIKKLENIPGDFNFPFFSKQNPSLMDCENDFRVMYHPVPLYTCSVLIRDYFDKLNPSDKIFCQKVIMKCVSYLIHSANPHQSIDGEDIVIRMLYFLLKSFPEKKFEIKSMLLKLFIKREDLDKHTIKVVVDMWEDSFEDAHSIFVGYLLLKQNFYQKYQITSNNLHINYSKKEVLNSFIKENEKDIKNIIENKLTYHTIFKSCDFKEFDLYNLIIAFEMLPLKIENTDHKKFIRSITTVFMEKLFSSNKLQNSYELKIQFLDNFSNFILTLDSKEIKLYIKPFLDNFEKIRIQEFQEYFFSSFISTVDKTYQYENFWIVWNLFYPKIVEMLQKDISDFDRIIIYNYLLAGPLWKKDTKDWFILIHREKLFFKKVSEDIGHHPTVLDSISKFLNEIGSYFIDDGILWISDIIKNNPNLSKISLEINTVFYMENILRIYVFKNHQKIKTKSYIRQQILIVLDFLVEKSSEVAYQLRENIL